MNKLLVISQSFEYASYLVLVPKMDFFVRSNISATYRSSNHLKRPYFGIIYLTLQIRSK